MKSWILTAASIAALLISITAAIFCWHVFHLAEASVHAQAVLNTDQTLTALSTNIAVLGVLVTSLGVAASIAAIVVGTVAIFGFAEMRASMERKIEEFIRKITNKMQASGELSSMQAKLIQEGIQPDITPRSVAPSTTQTESNQQRVEGRTSSSTDTMEELGRKYPQGGTDANH